MAKNGILMAGQKAMTITVYPQAISGSPTIYNDVLWWKVSYTRVLVIRGDGWTVILKRKEWNSIRVEE